MNWLAHAFLSEPDVEARLGNLLADHIKGRERVGLSDAFRRGLKLHQIIDSFTDYHPVVHRSRARLGDGWPHLTGILIDIFYDHFLAIDWELYSSESLERFTSRIYSEIRAFSPNLPLEAGEALERMIQDDRLASYRTLQGIGAALQRVSQRLTARTGREFALEPAVEDLMRNFEGLNRDFREFFPELQNRVAALHGTAE